MKTFHLKKEQVKRKWYVINLEGKTLGRAASRIALVLRGKNKADFSPHIDCGDFVIALNASKIRVTGKKEEQKFYYHHTGYMGGIKAVSLGELLAKNPEEVLVKAVSGMLPKNILGKDQIRKLKVYPDAKHEHQAQKPLEMAI